MKKKIAYGIICAAMMVAAFFVGRNTATESDPDKWADEYCESNVTITDWNTDGQELAFMLSNGIELYANKTETVYAPEHKNYIAFDEIADVTWMLDGTVVITSTDGNYYSVVPESK